MPQHSEQRTLSTAYDTLLSDYDDSGLLVRASNSNGTYTLDYVVRLSSLQKRGNENAAQRGCGQLVAAIGSVENTRS